MICDKCEYCEKNNSLVNIRIPKGMLKPLKKYCLHGKMRELSHKALGIYGYPVWCPLNKAKTCIECGTLIREVEGEYCKKHR